MGTIGAALMPGRVLGLKPCIWELAVLGLSYREVPSSHFGQWALLTDNEAQFWKRLQHMVLVCSVV